MPLGGAQRIGRLADVDAGVVDEDIEAAVTRRRLIDQRTTGGLARHIDRGEFGSAARARDAFHSRFAFFGIAPGQHHHGAGQAETLRHPEPDAAIAAGDDCDPARKIEQAHCSPPRR